MPDYTDMRVEQPIRDLRTCITYLKQTDFQVTVADMNRLPLHTLSVACRACLYAAFAYSKGKLGKSLAFLQLAKAHAADEEELAYLYHLEGVLFFMVGDAKTAIKRQHECIELCAFVSNGRLKADALCRLAFIFESVGQKDVARKYERQAARLLMRRDL
jgi:hypothetical protein